LVVPCSPPADVLFDWGTHRFVQEKALDIIRSEGLTGFWTKPAKARMKRTGESVPIRQLCVSGWGGVVAPESGIRMDEYCPGCQFSHYSPMTDPASLIDPLAWDGSDFFIIWPLPGFPFVTKRVRQVFRDNHLTGPQFLKTLPPETWHGYSPQRLSFIFPEARAHEIGDPLGIY
jgi:hypothetical protein